MHIYSMNGHSHSRSSFVHYHRLSVILALHRLNLDKKKAPFGAHVV